MLYFNFHALDAASSYHSRESSPTKATFCWLSLLASASYCIALVGFMGCMTALYFALAAWRIQQLSLDLSARTEHCSNDSNCCGVSLYSLFFVHSRRPNLDESRSIYKCDANADLQDSLFSCSRPFNVTPSALFRPTRDSNVACGYTKVSGVL